MIEYKNLSGKSNVVGYELHDKGIDVYFGRNTGKPSGYRYTNEVTGENEINKMKQLALSGKGLGAFLATKPYHKHERKL